MGRYDRYDEIHRLDAERDCVRIVRIIAQYECPWDMTQALGLALYRTYAVPAIGRLLGETGEFTARTAKRYDDTALLLGAVLERGFEHEEARTAVRRVNRMHRRFPIADDDMRYVLSTFVVVPDRWMDAYGWRRFTDHERRATTAYYRRLGALLGVRRIPGDYAEFADFMDGYERANFGFSEGGRAVSDATLAHMVAHYPRPLAPLVRTFFLSLLDEPLTDAFGYRRPPRAARALSRAALRLRGRVVRLLPPRREPRLVSDSPMITSYPDGYRVAGLGTFGPGEREEAPPGPGGPAAEGA
ncbi:oxygenase MpaB family protein [Allonocardiopsis opalescens]|uniref:Uncharacterized protein DUF2236 n=1 Tax=Allonocardiopsis opalescens TaxID=1144618 RepID=A0A2T0QCK5_9ACTN|nr:oxygenase MpaB family protein [Allonocardiopsis opalescens]PRY01600.1 uncharacterized protein DUF2236 [Allonocardiopsis opalescens]